MNNIDTLAVRIREQRNRVFDGHHCPQGLFGCGRLHELIRMEEELERLLQEKEAGA